MAAGRHSHRCVDEYHRNRTTYDLRRLRLRGLVERVPRTNRHLVATRRARPHATAVSNDSASLCARFALLACLWTLDPQSIHRDFNGVLLVLVERGYIADVRHEAVDAGATEAFAQEFLKEVQVLVLAIWHDRR